MTAWTPEWRVKINGSTLTDITLADFGVRNGRSNIYEQPTASNAQINLIVLNGASIAIDINDTVTIEVKNSSGSFVYLYGGTVSEITKSITSIGSTGFAQTFSILALGALARLPRQLTDGVLSKDYEGNQILTILQSVLLNSWQEVSPTLTWASYDPTTTWANAENVGLGDIDTPGNYELTARASSPTDVYSLVASLAQSGLGYIYENAQGQISYADSTHRTQYLTANGYVDLDAGQASGSGITISTRGQDVRNSIKITYKNNQTVTDDDLDSIATYGLLAQNIQTRLELTADATSQAAFYLSLRAYPQGNLESITFQLQNPAISSADRDSLLDVFMGMPVNLDGLPTNMGSIFQGFVEGWTWRASYNGLAITLLLSPLAYSLQAVKWMDVSASEYWNTLSSTLTWLEATQVA